MDGWMDGWMTSGRVASCGELGWQGGRVAGKGGSRVVGESGVYLLD